MWFSEELFLDHKSASMRQFLQSAIHLQSFKQVHTMPHADYCPLLDRYCHYNTGERLVGQRITVLSRFGTFLKSELKLLVQPPGHRVTCVH